MKSALQKSGRGLADRGAVRAPRGLALPVDGRPAVPTEVAQRRPPRVRADRRARHRGARAVFDPGVVVVRGGVIEAVGPAGHDRDPRRRARLRPARAGSSTRRSSIPTSRRTGSREAPARPDRRRGGGERTPAPGSGAAARRPRRPRSREPGAPGGARRSTTLRVAERVADTYRRLGLRGRRGGSRLRGSCAAAAPSSSLGDGPLEGRVLVERGRPVRLARARAVRLRATSAARSYPVFEDGRGRDGAAGVPRRPLVARRRGGLRAPARRAGAPALRRGRAALVAAAEGKRAGRLRGDATCCRSCARRRSRGN